MIQTIRSCFWCLLLLACAPPAHGEDAHRQPVFDETYFAEIQSENIALRNRIQNFPADIQKLNREVSAAIRAGDHPGAQRIAREMDSRYPDNADIKHFLGKLEASGNKREAAIVLFSDAIRLDPDNRWFYVSKAGAQAESAKLDDALATTEVLTQRFAGWSLGHNLKAALLDGLGREHEALLAYRQAVGMLPASAQILANKGDLHRRLGQFSAAEDAYKEALRVQPSYQRAQSALADIARQQQR